jgi:hypothetical protein
MKKIETIKSFVVQSVFYDELCYRNSRYEVAYMMNVRHTEHTKRRCTSMTRDEIFLFFFANINTRRQGQMQVF